VYGVGFNSHVRFRVLSAESQPMQLARAVELAPEVVDVSLDVAKQESERRKLWFYPSRLRQLTKQAFWTGYKPSIRVGMVVVHSTNAG
jgi:hypothetical protein